MIDFILHIEHRRFYGENFHFEVSLKFFYKHLWEVIMKFSPIKSENVHMVKRSASLS